jgi:electron transport complex protein RnfA
MNVLAALAVFSGLSLNLVLQFGLGVRNIKTESQKPIQYALFQWVVLFLTVFLLWALFSFALSPLSLGFMEYLLIFPLTMAVTRGLELLGGRAFPALIPKSRSLPASSSYDGLSIAALGLTLRLASSPAEAAVLSLGFSLGSFCSVLIVNSIYRRSFLEKVPQSLRGMPILLISMGLLSLIFSSMAVILLRILKVY